MGKKTTGVLSILVVIFLGLNIFQFYYFNYIGPKTPTEDTPLQIMDLKGSNWQSYIGKIVTVEGYYFSTRNEIAMLVSNPELPYLDEAIPNSKFIRLNGTIPKELQGCFGDRLRVKGTVRQASESGENIELLFDSYSIIAAAAIHRYEINIPVIVVGPILSRIKYAVLISGGVNSGMAYIRYWNDLKYMYSILRNTYGYAPQNIYVVYKDGIGEDNQIPVNYSATIANLQTVTTALSAKMTDKDTLFLFTNNHGSPTGLCLYYNTEVTHSQLATMLSGILNYNRMIIFMKQCFSGGFITHLSGPRRIILTACTEDQISYSADTEGSYGEFSYHFMKAVNLEVSADTDANGRVSMVEAFNWAGTHDSRPETPQYDDSGDGAGHPAIIPSGGDGTLGSTTYL